MFNDDGLGQAMALHNAQEAGKTARQHILDLETRVAALERVVAQLVDIINSRRP